MHKIVLIAAYACFGVGIVFGIATLAVDITYGDPKTITTDKDHPGIAEGYANYMEESKYEKYLLYGGILHQTCFCLGTSGILLYGIAYFLRRKKVANA